jgi:hypothetical protein
MKQKQNNITPGELGAMLNDGLVIERSFSIDNEEWVVIDQEKIVKFKFSDENRIRGYYSKKILEKEHNEKNPEETLRLLSMSSELNGFNLSYLVNNILKNGDKGKGLFESYMNSRIVPKP